MNRVHGGIGIGIFLLASSVVGCGGGSTTLPPEQKAPDYGQKSAQKMIDMYGVPGKKGAMVKPTPGK